MKQTIKLLNKGFESSTVKTPEFLTFARTFKKEISKELTERQCTNITLSVGHFYCSGFFTSPTGQIYYFSISDVRSYNENYGGHFSSLLYRTAKSYQDYTGGCNQYVKFEKDMVQNMRLL